MSRLSGRMRIMTRALPRLTLKPLRRKPQVVRRVLIAHHLLLGDTLLLTPLIAKLRAQHPDAQIVLTCPKPIVPLYAGKPFGIDVIPFDPRDQRSVRAVLRSGPYDLGIVAGDNRHAWLALAAGCRWIVGHAHDLPAWKNWPLNQAVPYPDHPGAWADIAAGLIDGPAPRAYRTEDWPAPAPAALAEDDARILQQPYVVLHPGASTDVKRWPDERWRALAAYVETLGLRPVWSGGPSETGLIDAIDPAGRYASFAGRIDLRQVWHMFAGARAIVCPDTGVAHLGRLTGVPTIALFGPGNALIHGAGNYWRDAPFTPVTIAEMPCRDQPDIFRRYVAWARRCDRNTSTCVAWRGDHADCMGFISLEAVCKSLRAALPGVQ
ncbi:MAG: glycosyltransferase family 9 protein [Pseudomonadota bacterium]|jgi:ADP-heptose:LPS heptosyltransferase|uniref:glycosyltransferase family 9 protein n=1 Tax=unclassified Burkholderia TaxID=2613784 RepID=UPI00076B2421|nr:MULTISPECIES: glycosyltransferase family 9 protein [unclassified Burkholderia]AME24273.1 heptosyltransferase [Burkholderia sp. PAMC 26561]AMM13496.1 heptosyltransferase [Burkholderia sp. PAMC 28687]MDP9153915.1 glycosyltransferase family 9 protein [Pseudomonadota bacterium]